MRKLLARWFGRKAEEPEERSSALVLAPVARLKVSARASAPERAERKKFRIAQIESAKLRIKRRIARGENSEELRKRLVEYENSLRLLHRGKLERP